HPHRPPPRLRDGKPHGQFRPCRVRLFQERHYHHRRRQNGAGTGSGSRCYTKTGDLTSCKEADLTLLPLYNPPCSVVQWNHGIVGLAVGNGGFYVKTSHPKPHYRPLSEIVP